VLVLGVLLITAGRLGDIFGPRNVYLAGTALFTLSSAACGLSNSPGVLIAARAVQGAGAALLTPQPLAIVLPLFPPERRGTAFAINGVVAGVAAVLGPTLGGLIVTNWNWRGIFFVNLPVGILSIALTLLIVPDLRPGRRHRLDISGVLVATASLTLVMFGLIEGQRYDWGQVWGFITIPLMLAVGVALFVVFIIMQRRRQTGGREPLVPFALFKDRNYSLMLGVGAAMQLGLSGLFLPFTIYLQSVLGLTALQAGLVYVPSSVISMFMTPILGRLTDRIGGKYILMSGLALFGLGTALQAIVAEPDSSRWVFLPGVIISGFGLAGIFVPMITVAMGEVPPMLAGAASGLINTTRQIGGALGGAIVGAILQNRLAASLRDEAAARADALPAQARGGFIQGFSHAGSSGLEVGAGQTGSSFKPPPGTPTDVVRLIARVAHDVFDYAFVSAMRWSMIVPAFVLFAAAASCVLIRKRRDLPAQAPEAAVV
jgi:EmrB/QacA subfamily drug resistance transporter